MGQNTGNTTAFIEAEQYSKFILENLEDGLLPDTFTRDVSDFSEGTTLNVKSVGTVTLQESEEDIPPVFNAIDTSTVTLAITDWPADAWSISDKLREDGSQVEQLHAMRARASTRAFQEHFETQFLAACNGAQTDANANDINGFAHRIVSAETSDVISLNHFVDMKLAFNKAKVPLGGRIGIVDPVVEATINKMFTTTVSIDRNPQFLGMVREGFADDHKFVANIMGFDIWVSNYLPTNSGAETYSDGTASTAAGDGVANVFMCVGDDQTRPIMRAWRRMPKVEGWRDPDFEQDKFRASARFGFGAQRVDTLGIICTSKTNY